MPRVDSPGWIQTFTGKKYYPIAPRSEDVDIMDIAHSLSMQCRFNGHCLRFYSVAEHSVHISKWLLQRYGLEAAMCGLLHDGTEAYVADVPSPLKPYLIGYKEIEIRNWLAIADAFMLPHDMPDSVKEADQRILADEALAIMAKPPEMWSTKYDPLGIHIRCWKPERAKEEFLRMFIELQIGVDTNG